MQVCLGTPWRHCYSKFIIEQHAPWSTDILRGSESNEIPGGRIVGISERLFYTVGVVGRREIFHDNAYCRARPQAFAEHSNKPHIL